MAGESVEPVLTKRPHEALGFTFSFESDDSVLVGVVERLYRDLPVSSFTDATVIQAALDETRQTYELTVVRPDGEVEQRGGGRGRGRILELLCWEVNGRAIRSATPHPILHAAVFAGPLGAVAVCGVSGSGKSTLAAAAAQRGWEHLSDDLAPIDVDTMRVSPYPRPIMIRPGGRALLERPVEPPAAHLEFFTNEWFAPASELGATVANSPRSLVGVVFLDRSDSVVLEPISQADLLYEMTQHSANLIERRAIGFAELVTIADRVAGYRLRLGELGRALDLLAPLVGHSA